MTSGIPAYVYLRLMDRWQLGSASNCKRRRNREQSVKIEPDVIYPVGSPQTLRVVYASLGFRTLVPDVRMKRNPPRPPCRLRYLSYKCDHNALYSAELHKDCAL
jgi:hypothetical protein